MKLKTIGSRILVTPIETEDTTNELGLTLPDSYSMQGLEKVDVVYSGDEIKEKNYITPGHQLLIYQGSGTKVMEGGKEYRVINITDVVIIYE